MKLRYFYALLFVSLFIVPGCNKQLVADSAPATGGASAITAADFSRYIAVGNSLTAGYADGGLYLAGQQAAYPNIVAAQMKTIGGGNFVTPLFPVDQLNGSGYLRLAGFNPDGTPNIVQVTDKLAIRGLVAIPGFGNVTLYTKFTGDFNNYGVPGIKLQQITFAPLGNLNGFYERLLPGIAGTNTTTYLDFVTAKPFTFFSNWLGNNDVLGYATSGGEGDVLTDKTQFAALYTLAVSRLVSNGAQGVVATIPDVTAIPYLTTVTVKSIVDKLKGVYSGLSAIYINALDPATGKFIARAATDKDLLGLTFNTANLGTVVNGLPGYGITLSNPIMGKDVLDATEVALAQDYLIAYNTIIKSVAGAYGLAIFDSYDFLNKIKAGMIINGVFVNSTFITGGVFSLDGVHLTPRGNAIAADEFIKAINTTYATKIPLVDISTYKGVL